MRVLLALYILIVGTAVHGEPRSEDIAAYRSLLEQDLRLASAGYRLAAANAPFCNNLAPNAGWVIHDIAQYPDAATAQSAFGFEKPIQIAAIVPGGPADRAGLKAGDSFVELGGFPLDWKSMPSGKTGYERMARFKRDIMENWRKTPGLPIKLVQNGAVKSVVLESNQTCASDFWVDSKSKLDAGADGEAVRITVGLMNFTPDEDELASIVAHELAHNVLGHRAKLDRITKSRTKAILATEVDADKLSVWMMANAGFDPNAAIRFWQRRGPSSSMGIFSSGTHPRWQDRIEVIQAEIHKIEQAKKIGESLAPPLLMAN